MALEHAQDTAMRLEHAQQLVGVREAAELAGVHPQTIRRWSRIGVLPTQRTAGGHRRFRRRDVEHLRDHAA